MGSPLRFSPPDSLPASLRCGSDRTLKHGQIRGTEGKGKETDNNQEEQGTAGKKRELQGGTAHFKVAGDQECDQDAESEDEDVCSDEIPPQISGISKKGGKNEKHSQQYTGEAGGQKASGGLKQNDDLKQCIDKYGKEKELQMLPHRFIDRSKQGDEGIFSAPFIAEMQQGPGNQGKQNAGSQVRPFADFHGKVPPLRIGFSMFSQEMLRKCNIYYIICNKAEMIIRKTLGKDDKNACPVSIFLVILPGIIQEEYKNGINIQKK